MMSHSHRTFTLETTNLFLNLIEVQLFDNFDHVFGALGRICTCTKLCLTEGDAERSDSATSIIDNLGENVLKSGKSANMRNMFH